jgi:hypothetical protein
MGEPYIKLREPSFLNVAPKTLWLDWLRTDRGEESRTARVNRDGFPGD